MESIPSQSKVNPISRGCELPSAEATNFLSRGYEARGALTFDLHLTCTLLAPSSLEKVTSTSLSLIFAQPIFYTLPNSEGCTQALFGSSPDSQVPAYPSSILANRKLGTQR